MNQESVYFDIETETMSGLHPWQSSMLSVAMSRKPSEMVIMTAGRNTGKSVINGANFQKLWNDIFNAGHPPLTDLVLDEGKVFGARYYTIEPVGGYWAEMEIWAKQTFGEPAEVWESEKFMWPECGRWYANNRKFWFRDVKDRDWFIMRWRS